MLTHFGLSWDDHHSALGDARVTAALFRSMRAELGDATLGIAGLLRVAGRSGWPGPSGVRLPPNSPPAVDQGLELDGPGAVGPESTGQSTVPPARGIYRGRGAPPARPVPRPERVDGPASGTAELLPGIVDALGAGHQG